MSQPEVVPSEFLDPVKIKALTKKRQKTLVDEEVVRPITIVVTIKHHPIQVESDQAASVSDLPWDLD